MHPKKVLRVLVISASATIIAIIFTTQSGMSTEGAVGFSALLVAICYEIAPPKP